MLLKRSITCNALLFITIILIGAAGCKREVGLDNANLKDPGIKIFLTNEGVVSAIRSDGEFKVDTIFPKVFDELRNPGKALTLADTNLYSYTWVDLGKITNVETKDIVGHKPYITTDSLSLGFKLLLFYVTEKETGRTKKTEVPVFILAPLQQGFAILCNNTDGPSLGFCTYLSGSYKKFTNLKDLGLDISTKGRALELEFIKENIVESSTTLPLPYPPMTFLIMSTQGFSAINSSTLHEYKGYGDVLTQTFPITEANADSTHIFRFPSINSYQVYHNNSIYNIGDQQLVGDETSTPDLVFGNYFDTKPGVLSDYNTLSETFLGQSVFGERPPKRFKASPYVWGPFPELMFDEDSCVFVKPPSLGFGLIPTAVFNLSPKVNLKGYKLISSASPSMNSLDPYSALFYNKTTNDLRLIQFSPTTTNGVIVKDGDRKIELNSERVINAKKVLIDPTSGYILFYENNVIYGCDYASSTPGNLVTLYTLPEDETISVFKFQNIQSDGLFLPPGGKDAYLALSKKLTVGSNKAGDFTTGGVFRLFDIPFSYQPLTVDTEQTGFPPIVDIDFIAIE